MADISLDLIKQLREKTQVGMMDCKKALIDSNGDFELAVENLRKKGAAVAAKRSENATNNGSVSLLISPDFTAGALAEVSCETDFSANTDDMRNFCASIAKQVLARDGSIFTQSNSEDVAQLMTQHLIDDKAHTVQSQLESLIAKIAESIKVSRFARFQTKTGLVNGYVHPGSNLGVMIELSTSQRPANITGIAQVAKDICMQIAVNNPICISPAELDQALIAKEKEVYAEQLRAEGKPEQMLEKILPGKLNKFYESVCLLNQKFIKDDKLSIQQLLDQAGKAAGAPLTIARFVRFSIGK